ncbi:MAG: hypothetical protein A2X49_00620 [Lentisphaerae bacterium GWF2_52_8]|nr:MAG: hypothetical protein A2X49_00620 [Lentisphaerae bacterium GWF2_52_8]
MLKKGTVIAIPPFTDFYFDIEPEFEMQNIHYRIWLENDELLEEHKTLPIMFSPDYFEYSLKLLDQMRKSILSPSKDNMKLPVMAHEIILKHLSSNKLTPSFKYFADGRISKVYKFLQSPDCAEYDAARMAGLCFLSVSQMNRTFKHYFKISPHKFWEKNRFKFICKALMNKSRPLSDIASDFSFTEQSYFSKWFKKIAGYSPAIYRKKIADKDELLT